MAKAFSVEVPIRFSNCDPAGIVYFPEFFDLINSLVEDWFTIGMDTSSADLMMRQHIGTPTNRHPVRIHQALPLWRTAQTGTRSHETRAHLVSPCRDRHGGGRAALAHPPCVVFPVHRNLPPGGYPRGTAREDGAVHVAPHRF